MKRINKALSISFVSYLVILFFLIVADTFINKDFDFIRASVISAVYIFLLSVYFALLFFIFNRVKEKTAKFSAPFKSHWLFVIIYIGMIFYLSSISDLPYVSKLAELDPRKFSLHIIEYGVFSVLLYIAISNTRFIYKWAFALTVIVGLIFGISDELYQSLIPGRRFNPLDILSDEIGIILGAIIAHIRYRRS